MWLPAWNQVSTTPWPAQRIIAGSATAVGDQQTLLESAWRPEVDFREAISGGRTWHEPEMCGLAARLPFRRAMARFCHCITCSAGLIGADRPAISGGIGA